MGGRQPNGRPEKRPDELAGRKGSKLKRFSIEVPLELAMAVDQEASRNDRSRVAETRVLLAEALEARRASSQ